MLLIFIKFMRLWTIHPKYLDAKGLVALWREGLLAKAVLEEKTKGYQRHPQLYRFKEQKDPASYINQYLQGVYLESLVRNYKFDRSKLPPLREFRFPEIVENKGQLQYEWQHLLNKLKYRDFIRFDEFKNITCPEPHPLFHIVKGGIQDWEVVSPKVCLEPGEKFWEKR